MQLRREDERIMKMNKAKDLIKLVTENPDLPIVAMVDSDVVCDDCGRWLGSFGSAYVGEYAIYGEKFYEEKDEFKEDYFSNHDEELEARFDFNPCITDYAVKIGRYTAEEYEKNLEADKALGEYLDKIAEGVFKKAIIVYVDLPDLWEVGE